MDCWSQWIETLAIQLLELGEFKAVTIEFGPKIYLQAMHTPGKLALQAVSNEFLPDELHLSSGAQQHMAELGWAQPDESQPNWHTSTEEPLDATTATSLAHTITASLRTVYGAAEPGTLRIVPFDVLAEPA